MMAPTLRSRLGQPSMPAADAGHHRVVDGRVAERAGDAESRDVVVGVHGGLEAHDGVHLEQRHRRRRALEIDLVEDAGGQRLGVDLEPDLERRRRIDALLDDFVQPELVGPDLLVAEGIEAKDLSAFVDLGSRRRLLRCLGCRRWCPGSLGGCCAGRATAQQRCGRQGHNGQTCVVNPCRSTRRRCRVVGQTGHVVPLVSCLWTNRRRRVAGCRGRQPTCDAPERYAIRLGSWWSVQYRTGLGPRTVGPDSRPAWPFSLSRSGTPGRIRPICPRFVRPGTTRK